MSRKWSINDTLEVVELLVERNYELAFGKDTKPTIRERASKDFYFWKERYDELKKQYSISD